MANTPLIEAHGVSYAVDGASVIESVDLELSAGEIVTLIGPNGSGKTTLVRILLGLLKPSNGSVTCLEGVSIGYVPQRLHIEDALPINVGRFVALAGKVSKDRVATALDEVGAAALARKPVQRLSPGELQRVLLARAIVRQPDVLVLDEPAQGVDILGQDDLYGLIADLRDRYGSAILMISHDLHFVMAASDRVICLNSHICCSGKPDAVTQHPAYLELFGKSALAIAPYTHVHDHHHHDDRSIHPGQDHELDSAGSDDAF